MPVNMTKPIDQDWLALSVPEALITQRNRISWVGLIGLTLPLLVWLIDTQLNNACFRDSLSHYYYARISGDLFIVALTIAGAMLVAYRGETRRINRLASLAGVAAFCVAFFPTTLPGCDLGQFSARAFTLVTIDTGGISGTAPTFEAFPYVDNLHYAAATLLFGLMVYFCWCVFPLISVADVDPATGRIRPIKRLRNAIYRICAGIILAISLGLLGAYAAGLLSWDWAFWDRWNLTFWFETIGLMAFGTAWLVKGRMFNLRFMGA